MHLSWLKRTRISGRVTESAPVGQMEVQAVHSIHRPDATARPEQAIMRQHPIERQIAEQRPGSSGRSPHHQSSPFFRNDPRTENVHLKLILVMSW
jgi:hypothetical protein